jgi:hypothetical protein
VCTCSAGYYVKVMKKIQDKGDEYIKNENERLGRILGKSCTSTLQCLRTFVVGAGGWVGRQE